MKIAPIDIVHKTFSRKLTGIDEEEVLLFLKDVASELEQVVRDRNDLKEQVRQKDLQLYEFKERDHALKDTIMTAHKMTEQLRKDADREANLIINDAQQRADMIVRDARDGLKKIYSEITELKKQKTQFEVGLRGLISTHLELLERAQGYLPHVSDPSEASLGGSTPNLRQGKPLGNV